VKVKVSSEYFGPEDTCQIISVSSSEPEDGVGDGNFTPDWEITGDLMVDLRAERSGPDTGRIYTITVQCTDDVSGTTATASTEVIVPHDQGKKDCVLKDKIKDKIKDKKDCVLKDKIKDKIKDKKDCVLKDKIADKIKDKKDCVLKDKIEEKIKDKKDCVLKDKIADKIKDKKDCALKDKIEEKIKDRQDKLEELRDKIDSSCLLKKSKDKEESSSKLKKKSDSCITAKK